MKNILLPICLICLSLSAFSQSMKLPKHAESHVITNQFEDFKPSISGTYVKNNSQSLYGTVIGTTSYDLQSNYSNGNTRIVRYDDGGIAAVWTQSLDFNSSTTWPDRGTGYNYYNPNTQSWGSGETGQFGLSTLRTGWPQIVNVSSGEVVLQHDFGSGFVVSNSRSLQGASNWSNSTTVGFIGVWPRAVASGDTIHMLTVDNSGGIINDITVPMEYHRSDDKGQTWSISNYSNFPNYDTTTIWMKNIGAESYSIDAKGKYVAVLVGGGHNPLVLYKSDNFGEDGSWTETIIYFPDSTYSFRDSTAQVYRVPSVGNGTTMVLDDSGQVHMSATGIAVSWEFGASKPLNSLGQQLYFPALSACLYYWNESMGPMDFVTSPFVTDEIPPAGNIWNPIATFYDYNEDSIYGIPWNVEGGLDSIGSYNGGLAGHASMSMDGNGGIFIVWSQVAETSTLISDLYQRDIYMVYSFDNGQSWSEIVSIAQLELGDDGITGGALGEENVFPSTTKRVGSDDILHLVFQADPLGGMSVQGDMHPISTNEIVYLGVDISQFRSTSLNDHKVKSFAKLFPNPAKDLVTISSKKPIKDLQVLNNLGQIVNVNLSTNGEFKITADLANLETGIYFFRVYNGTESEIHKIIKE